MDRQEPAAKGAHVGMRRLVVYQEDFKSYVSSAIDRFMRPLEGLYGISIEKPALAYLPYPTGILGIAYVKGDNTVLCSKGALDLYNGGQGGRDVLDASIAHELGHAYMHRLMGGTSGPGAREVIRRIASMPDAGMSRMVSDSGTASAEKRLFRAMSEGIADFSSAFAVESVNAGRADAGRVLLRLLEKAEYYVSAFAALLDGAAAGGGSPMHDKFAERMVVSAANSDRHDVVVWALRNYVRPKLLLVEMFLADPEASLPGFARGCMRDTLDACVPDGGGGNAGQARRPRSRFMLDNELERLRSDPGNDMLRADKAERARTALEQARQNLEALRGMVARLGRR